MFLLLSNYVYILNTIIPVYSIISTRYNFSEKKCGVVKRIGQYVFTLVRLINTQ